MERDIYRAQYLAHWNAANGGKPPDVILCPVQGVPASRIDNAK
jgi:hypothetical protein